ncbi:hypothetical protein H632_c4158p0, partial [Helicosporidium sp. ATCC 50920]
HLQLLRGPLERLGCDHLCGAGMPVRCSIARPAVSAAGVHLRGCSGRAQLLAEPGPFEQQRGPLAGPVAARPLLLHLPPPRALGRGPEDRHRALPPPAPAHPAARLRRRRGHGGSPGALCAARPGLCSAGLGLGSRGAVRDDAGSHGPAVGLGPAPRGGRARAHGGAHGGGGPVQRRQRHHAVQRPQRHPGSSRRGPGRG